ncbi:sodium:solute symporter [Salipiger sp. IMCC34102]|uniref:ATP-binding protein n=1 Tax=Salipiger sp. IMCC34102 TaxID=2510647 RepID=UPI00101E1A71|nr:ATP-binding protein [Salipiger sp. IMCC34102]RYH02728.1 sodium:solute symporter [Salipiger sp. IMCC34102]
MMSFNALILAALVYVAFLFSIAFLAERQARRGRDRWLRLPLVYTLSLSIYCTAWTFYGAVGYAARSGLEYVTIYLGPTLVMVGWWTILRKLVRIGRTQGITSIADLISSRFGKSTTLGMIVTVMAVVAATPYIALQLQSVVLSVEVFARVGGSDWGPQDLRIAAIFVAVGLAVFTILFGTRHVDAGERHNGIVIAIAVEAVVKLVALLAVGLFVVWGLSDGPTAILQEIDASRIGTWSQPGGRWVGLIFLSAAAFLCLPRMFQVLVVENADEAHLKTASWAFPLYMLLMSLFVLPIAVVGLRLMPEGANPDLFVLTLPLAQDRQGLAVLAFLGGFSSATSMVIVATIALATMVSNHVVLPVWMRSRGPERATMSGDVRWVAVLTRRLAIVGTLALGWLYYSLSGGGAALAAIGLVSFSGVVQVLPVLLGGIFWRGATRTGAILGLTLGGALWVWTLFLPSFGEGAILSARILAEGPWGIGALRPQALLGIEGIDPLLHGLLWSLLVNTGAFIAGSVLSFPAPLERLQGAQFVNVFEGATSGQAWKRSVATAEDLLILSQRIIGAQQSQAMFQRAARAQGKTDLLPDVTPAFLEGLERTLAGSVGAATAHAMIAQLAQGTSVTVDDLFALADETAQILEYSGRLEAKSAEQERTALALREANEKLVALSAQKDAFLSQVSHELRTPMTSIRAFSGILTQHGLNPEETARMAGIINAEALRLTRLLDDLLDLSVLEAGQVSLQVQDGQLGAVLDRAIAAAGAGAQALDLDRVPEEEAIAVSTDLDRLAQVFINLVSNAAKYCDATRPRLTIRVTRSGDWVQVDFTDNGSGIARQDAAVIFEKFSRLTDSARAGGAGLGLAICRELMTRMGGQIDYVDAGPGATFRVKLPQRSPLAGTTSRVFTAR